jgi:fatty acid desaturase
MSASDWREQLPVKVRNLQIIVGALSFGCFSFLIIAVFVSQNLNKATEQPMLTYIALLMAAIIFGIWFFLPGIIVAQGRKNIQQTLLSRAKQVGQNSVADKTEKENSKAQALMNLLQTKTIVGCAILEGAVFLLLIAYMVEHSMPSITAAIALLLLLMAQMPTIGRATNWIENQLPLVDV